MERKFEIFTIYITGLIQGLVLVTVPAASSVLTDSNAFGFSAGAYGALFIPQVIMAIPGALLGPKLSRRRGLKSIYQSGLVFSVCAMALICASEWFRYNHDLAYICILLGTTAVGMGFGTTLPMINVYTQRFFPNNTAAALTGLHALLGTGTALAPLLIALLMASYMPGYGLASYGIGKIIEISGYRLGSLYRFSIVAAIGIIVLGIVLTQKEDLRGLKEKYEF